MLRRQRQGRSTGRGSSRARKRAAHHLARLNEMRPNFRLGTFKKILPYRNRQTLERFLETFREAGIED